MITEDYCSFKVAELLKEKGFDEPCRTYYQDGEFVNTVCTQYYQWNSKSPFGHISAPTLQMAMKWLREAHQLHISVDINPIYGKTKNEKGRSTCGLLYWHYMASGEWLNEKRDPFKKAFVVSAKSYEEAVEAALKYVLENLI